jgi:hypothetical protein
MSLAKAKLKREGFMPSRRTRFERNSVLDRIPDQFVVVTETKARLARIYPALEMQRFLIQSLSPSWL